MMATEAKIEETRESLERVQKFEASAVARVDDLGRQLNFVEAVKPVEILVDIYKRIPLSVLDDLTDQQLEIIKSQSQADYQLFEQMLEFDATRSDSATARNTLISQVQVRRDAAFQQLWQFIAYGVARLTDTNLLETQARATFQNIKDQAKALTDQLSENKDAADRALEAIRSVAAEQGVSQQAVYFKNEAQEQENKATTWLKQTYQFAAGLGIFAVVGLFLHRWDWLAPKTSSETFQFVTSKVLIFAVLGYLLIMSARNYATHKHNGVVNRHRQNALLTYRALVEAAVERGTEDIVLAHAASCIFAPQETGFSNSKGEGAGGSKSVLELMTKSAHRASE